MGLFREVELTIDEDGNVEVEVHGLRGPSCVDLTKGLEKALGKVTSTKMTSEYFQSSQGQILKQRNTGP